MKLWKRLKAEVVPVIVLISAIAIFVWFCWFLVELGSIPGAQRWPS